MSATSTASRMATATTFFSPMPTSTWSGLSARSRLFSQSIAVAGPEIATPAASVPMSRAMASQEPRSDQAPA